MAETYLQALGLLPPALLAISLARLQTSGDLGSALNPPVSQRNDGGRSGRSFAQQSLDNRKQLLPTEGLGQNRRLLECLRQRLSSVAGGKCKRNRLLRQCGYKLVNHAALLDANLAGGIKSLTPACADFAALPPSPHCAMSAAIMAETHLKAERSRPLSPHLTIFRPLITMVMSIVHRITGVGLYFGMLLLAWWLLAAASGPDAFETANSFFGSWFGRLILFGFTWALIHHLLGGIRHLVWDTGTGFDPPVANRLAWATIIGSVALTLLVWVIGYAIR